MGTSYYTAPSDVFVPQVVGEMARTYLYYKLALIGNGFAQEAEAIWNGDGSTVTLPYVTGFSGSSGTLATDGTQVDSQKFSVTSTTASVTAKIISIAMAGATLEDVARDINLYNEMLMQVQQAVAKDVDAALITAAETTALSTTTGGPICYEDIVKAKLNWGDSMNDDACLVVHSTVYADLLKLAQVSTWQNWGGNPVAPSGRVPMIAGLPVFVSDNLTNSTTYTNLIIRRGGLKFAFKRALKVDLKKEKGNDMTYFDWTYRYTTYLKPAPTGRDNAIKLITTANS